MCWLSCMYQCVVLAVVEVVADELCWRCPHISNGKGSPTVIHACLTRRSDIFVNVL